MDMSAILDDPGALDAASPSRPTDGSAGAASGGPPLRTILDRLLQATEGIPLREIARRTRCHPETVRRYFRRARLSLRFFAAICEQFGVSPEWLLWGTEPMRRRTHPVRRGELPLLVTASFEIREGTAVVKNVECRRS